MSQRLIVGRSSVEPASSSRGPHAGRRCSLSIMPRHLHYASTWAEAYDHFSEVGGTSQIRWYCAIGGGLLAIGGAYDMLTDEADAEPLVLVASTS